MLNINGVARLGQEPKMQYDKNGNAVTTFSAAADVGFGDKKETIWVRFASFGKQAEILNQYLEKGSKLAFAAEITKVSGYTKKDNTIGTNVEARIQTFEFLSPAAKQDGTPYDGEEVEEF